MSLSFFITPQYRVHKGSSVWEIVKKLLNFRNIEYLQSNLKIIVRIIQRTILEVQLDVHLVVKELDLLECKLWLQATFIVEDIHIYDTISPIFYVTKTYESYSGATKRVFQHPRARAHWFSNLCITGCAMID